MPALVGLLALWLATVCNVALWQQPWALPEVNGWRGLRFMLGMLVWLWACWRCSSACWPGQRVFKPVAVILLMSAAAATHFMLAFSTSSTRACWSTCCTPTPRKPPTCSRCAGFHAAGAGRAARRWAVAAASAPVQGAAPHRHQRRHAAGGHLVAGLALYVVFQDFASVMRNHKQVRYLINLLNSVYAVAKVVADTAPRRSSSPASRGEDARPGPSYTNQTRPLLVVVG